MLQLHDEEVFSISTPKLYNCWIGALHAKKFNGRGPKLMIFKLLNPTTALAIGTISDYNLHSAYHNMHLHVHLTDYLLFPLLLQRTFLVLQNVWQVMFLRFTDKLSGKQSLLTATIPIFTFGILLI